MKIAVLDAVPRQYWQVDNNYTDAEKIVDLLAPISDAIEYKVYYVAENEWPNSPSGYDGFIISGNPCSANDDFDWIHNLSDLIADVSSANKRLMGICFGHQLIAKTFGGKVSQREHGWYLGLKAVELTRNLDWMSPKADRVNLYHINKDEVSTLPEMAVSYVLSANGKNDGYTIGDNIFCIQGHPEQPKASMLKFIEHLKQTDTPLEKFDRAIESIQTRQPDKTIFANWIIQFLNH